MFHEQEVAGSTGNFFFFTLVAGPSRSLSLKLSDTTAYEPQIRARLGTTGGLRILKENIFNLKVSGNEVYCTNALLLLMHIVLRSKLHCQNFLN